MIRSDKDIADICASSVDIVSKKTLLKNHPFVEDAEEELKQIEKEEEENAKKEEQAMYGDAFNSSKEKDQKDQQEVEDV